MADVVVVMVTGVADVVVVMVTGVADVVVVDDLNII